MLCSNLSNNHLPYFLLLNSTGESAVGKSSLVLRFVKGQFHEYQESTIGGEGYCHSQNQLLTLVLKLCLEKITENYYSVLSLLDFINF